MKNLKLFASALTLFSIISCSSSDDNNSGSIDPTPPTANKKSPTKITKSINGATKTYIYSYISGTDIINAIIEEEKNDKEATEFLYENDQLTKVIEKETGEHDDIYTFKYSSDNKQITVIKNNITEDILTINDRGQLTKKQDPKKLHNKTYEYDSNGNMISETETENGKVEIELYSYNNTKGNSWCI